MQKLHGNERAYRTLAAWIGGGRLPHAILLEGPAGCGKTAFADEIAQAILCEGETAPCSICRHCVKVKKGIHPDYLRFEGEGRARSFHIETVRELRSKAFVYPNEADRKVFLLRNVQDMSVQAQNALLKILEEPPETVVFILTCENKSMLLETILSRVTALQLELPSLEECGEVLRERFPEESEEKLRDAVTAAGGNMGRALELAEGGSSGLGETARTVWTSLAAGREMDALAVLSKFDRDRKGFLELAAALRSLVEGLVLSPEIGAVDRISPLLLMQIIAIIDDVAAACAGNGSISLLGCSLCARITAVLMK